jgi:hypothetical protein
MNFYFKIFICSIYSILNLFLCTALPINKNKNKNNTVFDISYKSDSMDILNTYIFYSFVIEFTCVLSFLYFFIMCIKR